MHADVPGRTDPAGRLRRLNGRKVYDDERLDRVDSRCRLRTDEDGVQIPRIIIGVIDAGFGPALFEEVMRREVAVNDIRMPAIVIATRMEVLRRQEPRAKHAQHGQSDDDASCQAVCHYERLSRATSGRVKRRRYQPTRTPVVHEKPVYSPPSFARSFMSAH